MKTIEINSLVLAYLGDCIYEKYIREFLIKKEIATVKELQQMAIKYVSASRQAFFLKTLLEQSFFNEEEQRILKRARNTKSHSAPKGCDIMTYKQATALEALLGYLYLEKQESRINEIMHYITEGEIK